MTPSQLDSSVIHKTPPGKLETEILRLFYPDQEWDSTEIKQQLGQKRDVSVNSVGSSLMRLKKQGHLAKVGVRSGGGWGGGRKRHILALTDQGRRFASTWLRVVELDS